MFFQQVIIFGNVVSYDILIVSQAQTELNYFKSFDTAFPPLPEELLHCQEKKKGFISGKLWLINLC